MADPNKGTGKKLKDQDVGFIQMRIQGTLSGLNMPLFKMLEIQCAKLRILKSLLLERYRYLLC